MITLYRTIGNASVDHHDRHIHLAAGPQEVWPQLRLHRHENAGTNLSQNMTGKPGKVKREIYYTVGILYDAVCHLVTVVGNDGNENRALGKFGAELLDEGAGCHYLTNRGRMYPYTVFLRHPLNSIRGEKSKHTLAYALDKAPFADCPDKEYRYY